MPGSVVTGGKALIFNPPAFCAICLVTWLVAWLFLLSVKQCQGTEKGLRSPVVLAHLSGSTWALRQGPPGSNPPALLGDASVSCSTTPHSNPPSKPGLCQKSQPGLSLRSPAGCGILAKNLLSLRNFAGPSLHCTLSQSGPLIWSRTQVQSGCRLFVCAVLFVERLISHINLTKRGNNRGRKKRGLQIPESPRTLISKHIDFL